MTIIINDFIYKPLIFFRNTKYKDFNPRNSQLYLTKIFWIGLQCSASKYLYWFINQSPLIWIIQILTSYFKRVLLSYLHEKAQIRTNLKNQIDLILLWNLYDIKHSDELSVSWFLLAGLVYLSEVSVKHKVCWNTNSTQKCLLVNGLTNERAIWLIGVLIASYCKYV